MNRTSQKQIRPELSLDSVQPGSSTQPSNSVQPGFFDMQTGKSYPATFADGRLAPIHICDGLPSAVVERIDVNIISGYLVDSLFYTYQELQKLQRKQNNEAA